MLPFVVPLDLTGLPTPTYLVGGAVRDHLLGRQRGDGVLDLDFMLVADALEWGSRLARQWGGGYVVLDRERQIARVVLPKVTIDLATMVGGSLLNDLKQRDFTCNAIALEIHDQEVIDPLHGWADIQARQLRMIHPDNLSADPVRLLRGYRQTAQLGFMMTPETRQAIQSRGGLLKTVAGERIRTELTYLLSASHSGLAALAQAWQDGVLRDWLPGLQPSGWLWAERLLRLHPAFAQRWPHIAQALGHPLADTRPISHLVMLLGLWHGLAAAELDHHLEALRFSRLERQWAQKIHKTLPSFLTYLSVTPPPETMYAIFEATGKAFPALAWLSMGATASLVELDPWLRRYEDPADPIAHLIPVLDGQQLMQALGIPSSPLVGQLLQQVKLAQVRGEVRTKSEGIAWAQRWQQQQ